MDRSFSAYDTHRTIVRLIGLLLLVMLTGCQSMNNTQRTGLVGTGLGALGGAIVGGPEHSTEGALIGGAAGLIAGSLVGAEEDRIEQDIAMQQVHFEQHQSAIALTNFDLVQMTHAGVSDDVIIAAARDRGGRFDLSPPGIISLKNSGVSDAVILGAQSASRPMPPIVSHTRAPRISNVSYSVDIGPSRPVFFHHHGRHHHRHCDW